MSHWNAPWMPWQRTGLYKAEEGESGFQTAEAIGIAAVGLLVLFGIWGAMSALGVDVVEWIRSTFGIGGVPGS